MSVFLIVLAFWVGVFVGHVAVNRAADGLSDGQLTDIYRREHQRALDGRAQAWE